MRWGHLYTVNNKGELSAGSGKPEETVRVLAGKNPLSLLVYSDYYARILGRRFNLNGIISPDYVAPVVVGVKLDQAKPSQAQAAAQKVAGVLVPEDKFNALQDAYRKFGPALKAFMPDLAPPFEAVFGPA